MGAGFNQVPFNGPTEVNSGVEASPYDLLAVDDLIVYGNFGTNGNQPATPLQQIVMQEIITGWSKAVYSIVGRTPPMLSEPTEFTETYNGSGSGVLYLLNAPILSVSSLLVNGIAFPASAAYGQAGYFVQQDGKSIALRSGALRGYPFPEGYGWNSPYCFPRGRGNISITYQAGYDGVPVDLFLLSLKQCTIWMNKRAREDQGSKNIPNSGTDSYRAWAMQPEVLRMLQPYIRGAMVNIF